MVAAQVIAVTPKVIFDALDIVSCMCCIFLEVLNDWCCLWVSAYFAGDHYRFPHHRWFSQVFFSRDRARIHTPALQVLLAVGPRSIDLGTGYIHMWATPAHKADLRCGEWTAILRNWTMRQ